MSLRQPEHWGPGGPVSDADREREPADLLRLLNAEYTKSIIEAIQSESKPARAIAEECGASRPTVYRRLNALEDAGLVDCSMECDGDGRHRTRFETTLEAVFVDVTSDGLSVTVTTNGPDRPSPHHVVQPSD